MDKNTLQSEKQPLRKEDMLKPEVDIYNLFEKDEEKTVHKRR